MKPTLKTYINETFSGTQLSEIKEILAHPEALSVVIQKTSLLGKEAWAVCSKAKMDFWWHALKSRKLAEEWSHRHGLIVCSN